MSIREWLETNPTATMLSMAVVLLVAGGMLLYSMGIFGGSDPVANAKFYYYDVNNNELFVAEQQLLPPITAPSGGEGVRAQVYDCGDCANGHHVGLLQKYTPAAKRAIEKDMPPNPAGELVRLPGPDSQWVPASSPEGQKLRLESVAGARKFCEGQEPTLCFPK